MRKYNAIAIAVFLLLSFAFVNVLHAGQIEYIVNIYVFDTNGRYVRNETTNNYMGEGDTTLRVYENFYRIESSTLKVSSKSYDVDSEGNNIHPATFSWYEETDVIRRWFEANTN